MGSPVVLVTGAAQGIGAAIAFLMADAGYRVGVTAELELTEVTDHLSRLDRLVHARVADLSSPALIEEIIGEITAATGRLDVLVNNAGVTLNRPIEMCTDGDFERVVALNLKLPWLAARACVPIMRAGGGGGVIINVSSIHARLSQPGHSIYAATKGGVSALTRQLAVELAPDGIRVNAIEPGLIDVPRTRLVAERAGHDVSIPAGRAGLPTEVANAVLWLASSAASYITGATLRVDGGMSARLVINGG